MWGAEPNRFVAEAFSNASPQGKAIDLACGEGRNAIWLAEQGWDTTGVDFSRVAIERARKLAESRGVSVRFVEADLGSWTPEPAAYALVLIAYLQVPEEERQRIWKGAAEALAIGGELFAIGHAKRNLAEGVGGPQDVKVLWEPDEIARDLRSFGLRVDCAQHVSRPVADSPRDAIDVRVRAVRES